MVKTVNDPLVEDRRWLKYIATDWFTYVELKRLRMYSRNLESVIKFLRLIGVQGPPSKNVDFFLSRPSPGGECAEHG